MRNNNGEAACWAWPTQSQPHSTEQAAVQRSTAPRTDNHRQTNSSGDVRGKRWPAMITIRVWSRQDLNSSCFTLKTCSRCIAVKLMHHSLERSLVLMLFYYFFRAVLYFFHWNIFREFKCILYFRPKCHRKHVTWPAQWMTIDRVANYFKETYLLRQMSSLHLTFSAATALISGECLLFGWLHREPLGCVMTPHTLICWF